MLTVRAGDLSRTVDHPGGPGALDLVALRPATTYDVELTHERTRRRLSVRTLDAPPGAELARIATISDLHIGATTHGLSGTMFDRSRHAEPPPVRCARGAITAASRWGAEVLVGKGDLTEHGWAEEWQTLGQLLATHAGTMHCLGVPGNHDRTRVRDVTAEAGLIHAGFASAGLQVRDVEGARIIAFDSAEDGRAWGAVHRHGDDVLDAAADAARAGRAALVFLHHPLERTPARNRFPRGVRYADGQRFARALTGANPRVLLSAGHTHRNRRRAVGSLVHTEVGSTKDWPGVWAGYAVHEGGIRQVVRRIADPDVMPWIDYTRWAAGGLWWPYSPGRLGQRCFTHIWPEAPTGRAARDGGSRDTPGVPGTTPRAR